MSTVSVWRSGAGLAITALILAACAPAQRYETLSFFFDGVPAPPGVTPKLEKADPHAKKVRNNTLVPRARPVAPVPVAVVSVHPPVREKKCAECHDFKNQLDPIAPAAQLCDKCHAQQRQREGWNHGPINLGTCVPCHVAHESIYPHLLAKPVAQVCATCHESDLARGGAHHMVANINDCTTCHDPHRTILKGAAHQTPI